MRNLNTVSVTALIRTGIGRQFLCTLAGIPVLPFDQNAAIHFGNIVADLRKRHRDGGNQDRDKMIAAHARSLGCTVVTNNQKDFEMIDGLLLTDWRTPQDLKEKEDSF